MPSLSRPVVSRIIEVSSRITTIRCSSSPVVWTYSSRFAQPAIENSVRRWLSSCTTLEVGMPEQQQTDIAAYSLLTLADIGPKGKWSTAKNEWTRIHDVLQFSSHYYGKVYAENTRETIRKNCMHQFREAALIEDNGKATNSPNYCYRITDETILLIRTFREMRAPSA